MPGFRRMGQGYEPHVDELDGRLSYSLPVDSGFMSRTFAYDIVAADLEILLSDAYRREMLAVIAHAVLQRSTGPGAVEVTPAEFGTLVATVLHASAAELERYVDQVDRDHHICVRGYVADALQRRKGEAQER